MLHPYVFLSVAPIPLHDAIEEYGAIRKRKRVTEKKVTEIVDELLETGRAARAGIEPVLEAEQIKWLKSHAVA